MKKLTVPDVQVHYGVILVVGQPVLRASVQGASGSIEDVVEVAALVIIESEIEKRTPAETV